MAGGIWAVAVADGALSPPPRSEAIPAPAPAASTATRRTSPPAPAATLAPSPDEAVASRPIVTGRLIGRRGELGEAEALPGAGDGSQTVPSGVRAGYSGGGGDGDRRVGEDAAGFGFAAGAGEGEEDPVGVAGGGGQLA